MKDKPYMNKWLFWLGCLLLGLGSGTWGVYGLLFGVGLLMIIVFNPNLDS